MIIMNLDPLAHILKTQIFETPHLHELIDMLQDFILMQNSVLTSSVELRGNQVLHDSSAEGGDR